MSPTAARFAALLLVLDLSGSAGAPAQPIYAGSWTVATSAPAPWAQPGEAPVQSDLAALLGKSVRFLPDRVVAPQPLACRWPHYEMKDYASDMLFQGSLTDPAKQAAALGFQGATTKTLETGCEGAIDFHFVDQNAALFALNNRIYRLERKQK